MGIIDPCVSGVNEIKSLPNGIIRITCNTNESIELIEKEINEKEGENYILNETESGAKRRVKVLGMSKKYESEELKEKIKKTTFE